MIDRFLASALVATALIGSASAQAPAKRDIQGVALGMTVGEVLDQRARGCSYSVGEPARITCKDGKYSVSVSNLDNRIFTVGMTICNRPCTTYNPARVLDEVRAAYNVKLFQDQVDKNLWQGELGDDFRVWVQVYPDISLAITNPDEARKDAQAKEQAKRTAVPRL